MTTDPTPTDLLREAAALMRERAEAATPGPWETSVNDSGVSYRLLDASVITASLGDHVATAELDLHAIEGPHGAEGADAYHIASWHPAVALAVAVLLEGMAAEKWDFRHDEALAVARAYLGRDR